MKLMYVIFSENNLIDTGSMKSFVNSNIAQKYFKKFIKNDAFKISTVHGTSVNNFNTLMSCPKMF